MDWEIILLAIIASVIAPSIILVVKALIAYLQTKANSVADANMRAAIGSALVDLEIAATTAVNETEQVFVEMVKRNGKFDQEAQKEALHRSIARTKQIMTNYSYNVIQDATDHVELMIKAKVEEIVGGDKG